MRGGRLVSRTTRIAGDSEIVNWRSQPSCDFLEKAMSSSLVETEKRRKFLCCDLSSSLTVKKEMREMMKMDEETRTRSFPSREIGSARGKSGVDDVGSEKLSELRSRQQVLRRQLRFLVQYLPGPIYVSNYVDGLLALLSDSRCLMVDHVGKDLVPTKKSASEAWFI